MNGVGSMDLERARAVIAAHEQAEREKKNVELSKLIGRYFKYHNSYDDQHCWWLYATVTSVNEWGHLGGWSFQQTSNGLLEIEQRVSGLSFGLTPDWYEINAAEFWREAARISDIVAAQLLLGVIREKARQG